MHSNLEFLGRRYPRLAAEIKGIADTPFHLPFRMSDSPLRLFENDFLIDSTEEGFFSPLPSTQDAKRTLILLGFGLGSILRESLLRPAPETEEIIIIEPSRERFLFALAQTTFNEFFLDPKFHWIVGQTGADLDREFYSLLSDKRRLNLAKAFYFREHPVLSKLHQSAFTEVKMRWTSALEISKKGHGFLSDSLLGLKNSIENIRWLEKTPGINLLRNKFKGIPAIVASTGPSLTKSIPLLKDLQRKALILSADASLKILIQNGIIPHFVFCLERDEMSGKFFADIPREKSKSSYVAFPLVQNRVIAPYSGPHFAAYRDYAYYRFFEDQAPKGFLKCGPSVAHMALSFADYLGCKEAVLVGQDLAYDPMTLASHPSGIAYEEWSSEQSEQSLRRKLEATGDQLLWVPGNLAERVPTSGYYEVFRVNFGEMLARLRTPVINSTEGGAKIPGVSWKPLAEVSKTYSDQTDLFEKIQSFREKYKPCEATSLNIMLQTLDLALRKVSEIQAHLNLAKSFDAVLEVRKLQVELQQDPVFLALTGNFLGEKLVDLEWEWNRMIDHASYMDSKHTALINWVQESLATLEQVKAVVATTAPK